MSKFQECMADADLINKPRMMIESGKKVIISEGITDRQVYKKVFRTEIIGVGGKTKVKRAVARIEMPRYQNRFRAIVDRDYDFFLAREIKSDQFVYTDAHSLETMIWKMDRGNLLGLVLEKCIPLDLAHQITDSAAFKKKIFDVVYILGIVRLVNEMMFQEKKGCVRQDFVMSDRFFDYKTGEFCLDVFLMDLVQRSGKPELYDIYYRRVCEQLKKNYDKWEIMQGHDIAIVFIWFLSKMSDNPSEEICSDKYFERETRYSSYASDIRSCRLYDAVRKWEKGAAVEVKC